jgi:hypothetical protein
MQGAHAPVKRDGSQRERFGGAWVPPIDARRSAVSSLAASARAELGRRLDEHA